MPCPAPPLPAPPRPAPPRLASPRPAPPLALPFSTCAVPCRAVQCCAIRAVPCRVQFHAVPCHALLSCAMPVYVVLGHCIMCYVRVRCTWVWHATLAIIWPDKARCSAMRCGEVWCGSILQDHVDVDMAWFSLTFVCMYWCGMFCSGTVSVSVLLYCLCSCRCERMHLNTHNRGQLQARHAYTCRRMAAHAGATSSSYENDASKC